MKIYYAASIASLNGDPHFNELVINYLKKHGTVVSELLFKPNYRANETLDSLGIHDRDLNWVKESDVIVADVSVPSLGVGYELAHAKLWGKKVICLCDTRKCIRLSPMIEGHGKYEVIKFSDTDEALKAMDALFNSFKI
ncbi:MAG: nucleoside 2-deoxyribosyltransferase [Candidatus Pacearchaeota archaeon]